MEYKTPASRRVFSYRPAVCYTGSVHKSQWLIIALGTVGLVVGYSAVVVSQGDTAFASSRSCPMKEQTACVGAGCDKEACAKGECGKNCPGCAHANE